MKNENYRPRIIDAKIQKYLTIFGALLIEGPKWCGKTWTGKNNANSELLIASPQNNFNNKRLAELDPNLALEGASPRLIDEWQEVPQLFDAVRGKVDEDPSKGKFILTGSSSINKKLYFHSGTGRIARLRMRPMSLYESGISNGLVSLEDICLGKSKNVVVGETSLDTLLGAIVKGGWPVSMEASIEDGALIAREYVNNVLREDIYKVDDTKRDSHKIELLLRSLARNEATTATIKSLKNDIKSKDFDDINVDTVSEYLSLLDRLFLIENIPPYSSKIRSALRVKQSEKRHFVDPSLPCAILSLNKEKLLSDLEFLGFLFESLVERDLLTYVDSFGAKLYHYQDYERNEMDAVIELMDGSWCGVEIKLGANKIEEAAQNLLRINEEIGENGGEKAKALCVICGLSNAAYMRPDGVYVVPITSLKN